MLYQELPRIDSAPLDGWARWLGPALVAGAALSAATLLLLVGWLVLAAIVALAGLGAAAFVHRNVSRHRTTIEAVAVAPDYSVIGSALALSSDPAALTSGEGSLLIANTAYRERFGSSRLPLDLGESEQDRQGLEVARSMAWRDGAGCVAGVHTGSGKTAVEVERVGLAGDLLLWRFPRPATPPPFGISVDATQVCSPVPCSRCATQILN